MQPTARSRNEVKGLLKTLFSYAGNRRVPIFIALILAAAGAILTILGPNQLSRITDLISESLLGQIDLAAIGQVGGLLLAIYICSALFTYAEHYIMSTVTLEMSQRLRGELSRKINRVPLSYFNTTTHGDILSRVTNDVSTLQQTLANSLPSMISASAQFIGCLLMMLLTEWRMALAAIAVTVLGFAIMGLVISRSQRARFSPVPTQLKGRMTV